MTKKISVYNIGRWVEKAAKILGFESSTSFALTTLLIFAAILAAAVTVVLLFSLLVKRWKEHNVAGSVSCSSLIERAELVIKIESDASSNPPDYKECLKSYKWDETLDF